jgi:hypothetical protein
VPARIVEEKADTNAIVEGAEKYRKMAARYAKELLEMPWPPRR